ncbi:MAG: 1,6-anhydro-N-acetylmuramyl-L-alanine amidase AmpD [Candidatus Accumulibacter sp.]|uniref:1,6-anhydro-N-acetylmuramyl-L-alanine amidase AmpD n=1 Tax=Accumulibacter sp. TaxID=2053492 RepID=UPI001AC41D70|nr:1,6-anhydro-N-acetylmuramyl-L-alanine amidase AmpD [Accumulibacter sp.]MBN8437658.1 1,6-anhydro-N-acetylmuramyl-L-alanine amidase AmpD [Accumulibacter sp.]
MAVGPCRDGGWLERARHIESPNCDARPDGEHVSLVVVHAISLPPGHFGSDGIVQLFTNRLDPTAHPYFAQISGLRVSAHFLLRRNGELIQFVSGRQRAWHAGRSCWQGRERCNDFSLGIELEGCDDLPFEDAQYLGLVDLVRLLCAQYPIAAVVGHSDIAPGRKTDPGPCFDWRRLGSIGNLPGKLR